MKETFHVDIMNFSLLLEPDVAWQAYQRAFISNFYRRVWYFLAL